MATRAKLVTRPVVDWTKPPRSARTRKAHEVTMPETSWEELDRRAASRGLSRGRWIEWLMAQPENRSAEPAPTDDPPAALPI